MPFEDITRRQALGGAIAAAAGAAWPAMAMASEQSAATDVVDTTGGRVRGTRLGGVSRFFGIPYGSNTGTHRFQPARPAPVWTGIRECNTLGPKTPQGPITIRGLGSGFDAKSKALPVLMKIAAVTNANVPESEDCLVLNVLTPEASSRRKRPVMVWLHGGGFAMGSGFDPMTDGGLLAAKGDVVYVSLNHRLNALGFLYLAGMHPDFADSGNVGMLDIVLALQWVRENIAMFGGDPGNVTIFGQSGGGCKVSTLLGMPAARGLFHKAIVMSGPVTQAVDRDDAAAIAEQTVQKLGLARADVHQLQRLDYRQVIAAASAAGQPAGTPGVVRKSLAPVADGRSLPRHPFHPDAPQASRKVPMMIGVARDEATLFMAGDARLGAMSDEIARGRFRDYLGSSVADASYDRYRAAYPDDDPSYLVASMMTDRMFRSESIDMADRKSRQRSAPVFMYRVDYRPKVVNQLLRSPHGTEVPLVFGTKVPAEFMPSGDDVDALSETMMGCWLRFARTGDPAGSDLLWPAYHSARRETMIFDEACRVAFDPDPIARDPVARGQA